MDDLIGELLGLGLSGEFVRVLKGFPMMFARQADDS
jgi:hypothetical protein